MAVSYEQANKSLEKFKANYLIADPGEKGMAISAISTLGQMVLDGTPVQLEERDCLEDNCIAIFSTLDVSNEQLLQRHEGVRIVYKRVVLTD